MAKLEEYQKYILQIIYEYGKVKPAYGDTEVQIIVDKENHHYQLMVVGWNQLQRVYGCMLHIDIKNNKIWIQHDGTEIGIANELLELGVSKEDIVLAFQAPYKRSLRGFATG